MGYCVECGQPVSAVATYCVSCGTKVAVLMENPSPVEGRSAGTASTAQRSLKRPVLTALVVILVTLGVGIGVFAYRQWMPIPVRDYPKAVIGAWEATVMSKTGPVRIGITFREDGTGSTSGGDQESQITYVLDGSTVRMKMAGGANDGRPIEPADEILRMTSTSFDYGFGTDSVHYTRQ